MSFLSRPHCAMPPTSIPSTPTGPQEVSPATYSESAFMDPGISDFRQKQV